MLLWFSEKEDPGKRGLEPGPDSLKWVRDMRALVEDLTAAEGTRALLFHTERVNERTRSMLESMRRLFPTLPVVLVLPSYEAEAVRGTGFTVLEIDKDEFATRVRQAVDALDGGERRKHPRFDWPLRGRLRLPDGSRETYRVRSVSAGGAFLETHNGAPERGTQGRLEIFFGDFKLLAECEVLERRTSTERLPEGFGVRFTQITPTSVRVIDAIVKDELMRAVLHPELEPREPRIVPKHEE